MCRPIGRRARNERWRPKRRLRRPREESGRRRKRDALFSRGHCRRIPRESADRNSSRLSFGAHNTALDGGRTTGKALRTIGEIQIASPGDRDASGAVRCNLWATLNPSRDGAAEVFWRTASRAASAAGNIVGDHDSYTLDERRRHPSCGTGALAEVLEGFATVSIVAPSQEQSGAAQSLTLRQPIVCHKVGERNWAVDGTPADCVIVALHKLLPERPDLVISGINFGANLGENVYYSGTVGRQEKRRCIIFRRWRCHCVRKKRT